MASSDTKPNSACTSRRIGSNGPSRPLCRAMMTPTLMSANPLEHRARLLQVRLVDHPAVELERPRARIVGKGLDDRPGLGDLGLAWGEAGIDHRHLRRVDRHHAGKAVTLPARDIGGEPSVVGD